MTEADTAVGAAPPRIHRGLKDVHFDRSGVSDIDGRAGELRHRGYSVHELADSRALPATVLDLVAALRAAHPMEVLRTAVSALGALETEGDSPIALLRKGQRLTAQVPTIVAAHHRLRSGLEPVPPNPALGHAANFLYMLHGCEPSTEAARLMDIDLLLHAEHGSNASSFAARVVASTGANLHAAKTAAVGALSDPAHGGATEDVMRMARENDAHCRESRTPGTPGAPSRRWRRRARSSGSCWTAYYIPREPDRHQRPL